MTGGPFAFPVSVAEVGGSVVPAQVFHSTAVATKMQVGADESRLGTPYPMDPQSSIVVA